MELILYYIKESGIMLILYLILTFLVGIFTYLYIKKFNQNKEMKVSIYGLFLEANSMDIAKLSLLIIKTFLIIFSCTITYKTGTYIMIGMLVITSILYAILNLKGLVYEVVYSILEIVLIYLIYTITNYMIEVNSDNIVLYVKMAMIIIAEILAIYGFLRGANSIIEEKAKRTIKQEKEK